MFLAEREGPESQLDVPGGPEKGTASSPSVKRLDAGICVLFTQDLVQVPAAIDDAKDGDVFSLLVWMIKDTVMVYRHDSHASAVPGLFVIPAIPLRHLFQGVNDLFQPGELGGGIDGGEQLSGNILIDPVQVRGSLF